MASISRRQFGLAGAATALLGNMALSGNQAAAQTGPAVVAFPDGAKVPALGQGTYRLAEGHRPAAEEEEALRTGISIGMSVIDTAEMYGDGTSESMVGRVIAGQRDKVFLVSKVLPYNASTTRGIRDACRSSLKRLGTDYLDLYLLHWRTGAEKLDVVVDTFEHLRQEGRIRRWGVSNFSVSDMEELYRIPGAQGCATNQVRYNLQDRSIERDLVPWCDSHKIPIMAFSPLGKAGAMLKNDVLARVAGRHSQSPAVIALAWTIRSGRVISIPASGSSAHVRQNVAAMSLRLTDQDLQELDREFAV